MKSVNCFNYLILLVLCYLLIQIINCSKPGLRGKNMEKVALLEETMKQPNEIEPIGKKG